MAPPQDCFLELDDFLLATILERSTIGAQTGFKRRVQLETVCKRFQSVLLDATFIHWEFDGPNAQDIFVSYMLRAAGRLVKLKLIVQTELNLLTVLQAAILPAMDTLQEFKLLFDISYAESGMIAGFNWLHLFVMLQRCRNLRELDISVGFQPHLMDLAGSLKPFAKLRVLRLDGVCVSSARFSSFIRSFPALESATLHLPIYKNVPQGEYVFESTSVVELQWYSWESPAPGAEGNEVVIKTPSLEKLTIVGTSSADTFNVNCPNLEMLWLRLWPESEPRISSVSIPNVKEIYFGRSSWDHIVRPVLAGGASSVRKISFAEACSPMPLDITEMLDRCKSLEVLALDSSIWRRAAPWNEGVLTRLQALELALYEVHGAKNHCMESLFARVGSFNEDVMELERVRHMLGVCQGLNRLQLDFSNSRVLSEEPLWKALWDYVKGRIREFREEHLSCGITIQVRNLRGSVVQRIDLNS